MDRLNLSPLRMLQINTLLSTSSVTNFTAINSKYNGYSSNGNASAAVLLGQGRAGAGSGFRRQKFENNMNNPRSRRKIY